MRRITRAALKPAALIAAVSSPRRGAVVSFSGVVRAVHAGRRVTAVAYDCFTPLAEKELERILRQAEKKWPVAAAAAHRVGELRVGQASLAVAAASTHRPEAFAACRWIVEQVKRRLPVWKKERYVGGEGRWLPGCALHRAGSRA